jgi:flagellar hook-associated protein 1 FlgK
MRSTFHGLETSKRAILTQQTALFTVGHNIANAASKGYSKQRVNLSATKPIEAPGMQNSTAPGQLGTGVQYDSIERLRDSYLDLQFRRENAAANMWHVVDSTLDSIVALLNEPGESGLRSVMDKFWDALEVLNRDPGLLSARIDLVGAAVNMADAFNAVETGLNSLESDIQTNIERKLVQANGLIENISNLFTLIRRTEAMGNNANDYLDQRDRLVDELSKIVDVQVIETPDGGYSIVAAGVTVVANDTFTPLTADDVANAISGELAGYARSLGEVSLIRDQLNAMVDTLVNGEITVRLENGYMTSGPLVVLNEVTVRDASGNTVTYPAGSTVPAGSEIISPVEIRVNGFNGLHRLGYALPDGQTDIPFFVSSDGSGTFTLGNIRVNPAIVNNTNLVAASGKYEVVDGQVRTIRGNSDIAHALAGLRDKVFNYPADLTSLSSGTIDDYFRALVSDLGTRSNNAHRQSTNLKDLTEAIEIRRQEVSGVSLDEELADMLRFQHAYNAAARNMTTVDEMLDRIINHMGIVGR